MAAATNQDFITYQGDNVQPIFLVQKADGSPMDISSASEITWIARRSPTDPVVVTKTKSGGGIAFTNNGVDGKFTLTLTAADTNPLSGWYTHYASITDGSGRTTTVTVGRMDVGLAPLWTWNPGSVGIEPLYTVRNIIGDTIQSDQQLSDQQILWAISQYSNEWLAAAECCRDISAGYSRQIDIVQGQLKTNYSQRAKRYAILANDLEQRGFTRSGAAPYAGGTSISDKQTNVINSDRTPPQFLIGMFDNTLPESPIGHQAGVGQAPAAIEGSGISDAGGFP